MQKLLLCCGLAAAVLSQAPAQAQDAKTDAGKDLEINASQLKWGPAPAVLPKGASFAVLAGDPFKEGLYVVRLKLPSGYRVSAHSHPTDEFITVLSGNFYLGMGDKIDAAHGKPLTTGGFVVAPAKMNHYGLTTSPTVIQIHGQGPFQINYVDPTNDPSRVASGKK